MTAFDPVYEQGDVILVAYPIEERAGGRKRPVLVISPASFNEATGDLIVAQMTRRVSAPARPGDHQVRDWREANLPSPAIVRSRLATIPATLVLRRLGRLSSEDFNAALAGLQTAVDPED